MTRDVNDAWVDCSCGARHWGLQGAAGLALVDGEDLVLQHRSARSHHGGTWGLPGGAVQHGETALAAALREAQEETALPRETARPHVALVLDHGTWRYTTILASAVGPRPEVHPVDWESDDVAWVHLDEVAERDLLPAFGRAWPTIRRLLAARPLLVVDAANVVGSVPDGWWRDRAGATTRLLADVERAAGEGFPAEWFGLEGAALAWPRVVVVLEGAARAATYASDALEVIHASRDGDGTLAEFIASLEPAEASHAVLVTADRGLRARTSRVGHLGPGTFRAALRTLER